MRENEVRMQATGFPGVAHTAGGLYAGGRDGRPGRCACWPTRAVLSARRMMQWSQSGMLMIMVILGGVGHLYGGVLGAVVFPAARRSAGPLH